VSDLLWTLQDPALVLVALAVVRAVLGRRGRIRWRRVPVLLLAFWVTALMPAGLGRLLIGSGLGLLTAVLVVQFDDDDDDDPPPRKRELKPAEEEEPRVQGVPALRPSFG
jgi:hypothetical protein